MLPPSASEQQFILEAKTRIALASLAQHVRLKEALVSRVCAGCHLLSEVHIIFLPVTKLFVLTGRQI